MSELASILENLLNYRYSDIPYKYGRPIWLSFEDDIELTLFVRGFRKVDLEETGLTIEDINNRKNETDCSYNFYLRNPKGGSKSPDFIVAEKGKIFYLECKTSRSAYKPMWGSHYPQGKEVWIFCCGNRGKTFQMDETTIFLGEDIISPQTQEELSELQDQWLEEDRKINKWLQEKYGFIGLDLRPRKLIDCSTKEISPIYHPDRKSREEKVLEFVQETLETRKFDNP